MTTKFNIGDVVLIKGIVETIYVNTTDNEPIYYVRITGTHESCLIGFKEDIMQGRADMRKETENAIQ